MSIFCILFKCVYALETFAYSFFGEPYWRYDFEELFISAMAMAMIIR